MRYHKTASLFTDYRQFWLHDADADLDQTERLWTEQTTKDMLAVGSGIVCVGTVRNWYAPVTIDISDTEPMEPPDAWDHITECSLDVPSGRLVIYDRIADWETPRETVAVPPGTYRVRVHCGALERQHTPLEGDDYYMVALWPGSSIPPRVIKQRIYG